MLRVATADTTVEVTGNVATIIAVLLDIAPELPAGGYCLTFDVGRNGEVQPQLKRAWPSRKPRAATVVS